MWVCAIACSPAIVDANNDGVAEVYVGADYPGLFRLQLPGNPQWNPNRAPWPMFRHDIGRTGCAEAIYPCVAERGSVAGIVTYNGQPSGSLTVQAEGPGNPPEHRTTQTVSNGKYIFCILTPGSWTVHCSDGQGHSDEEVVSVTAGIQSRVDLELH
jgi:hypothetical protein